jgi:hypothetical protein
MNIITNFLPEYSRPRSGIGLKEITSITIHWIGPYPKQSVWSPYYWWRDGTDGKGIEASAHFIVKDDKVLQAIPEKEVAWHCGSKGNFSSLGIEVVPEDESGVFGPDTLLTLRQLLGTLPKVTLKRHYDWTGKNCPLYYTPFTDGGDKNWESLKEFLLS